MIKIHTKELPVSPRKPKSESVKRVIKQLDMLRLSVILYRI
jgi:hypothetical protein